MSIAAQATVRAMREDRGRFAALSGRRVLIYWPHGLGDWVHFGALAPLLEPSNTYAITRFGDDYVSVMEEHPQIFALCSGVRAPSDGADLGARHFGLSLRACNGGSVRMELPWPIGHNVSAFAPEILLWTDYPETEGRTPYPFHTKARNLARLLVPSARLRSFDLSQPLVNTVDFTAPPATQRRLDERLARFAPPGTRLCILSRAGVTAARKNWGDSSEARDFAMRMRRDDRRWHFVSMDDEHLGDGAAGFRELFADLDEPFARLYKGLAARAHLFVGIPAGPLHLTMARGSIPTIGLWLAHHPDWYDEPNPAAIHLIGRRVRDHGFDRRPATTSKPASLRHRLRYLDTPTIDSQAVLEAVRALIG